MDENAVKGMIVSYFLSREGKFAYEYLGFGTQAETHNAIGAKLGLKATYIKLTRDQFDSVTSSHRVGWYQRPLPRSRASIVAQFGPVSREALAALSARILDRDLPRLEVQVPANLVTVAETQTEDEASSTAASSRLITGRAAEKAFTDFFGDKQLPVPGTLVDCRDDGVGYDYRIDTTGLPHFVEVKGLRGRSGGILMTSKEWLTARSYRDRYHLALVTSVDSTPEVRICSNPGHNLVPSLRFVQVVQEQWTIDAESVLAVAS